MSRLPMFDYPWYEWPLFTIASLVGLGTGLAVLGDALKVAGLLFIGLIILCFFPAWREVIKARPEDRGWSEMREPHRSRFRGLMVSHLIGSCVYGAASLSLLVLLPLGFLDPGVLLILMALPLLAVLILSYVVGKRLRLLRVQEAGGEK